MDEIIECIRFLYEKENTNTNFVFETCKIPEFVNLKLLKEYVKQDIDSNLSYFNDMNITYRISDSKKSEWMIHKSIQNSKMVGNGSKSVDIKVSDKIMIDVSVLTLNKNITNEKSIMQNFKDSNNLDTLFNSKDGKSIVNIFRKKFQDKYKGMKEIYYMIFICSGKSIYLTCLKLNLDCISNMEFGGFTKTSKNITIENMISQKMGNVKLYKSKKRLELRLNRDILKRECTEKLY